MRAEPVTYNGFGGGVNTLLPARDIADDEVVSAINMELYQRSVLRCRNGLTSLATGLAGPVTSIFHYRASGGLETVLFTAGNQLYRMPVGGGSVTNLTGALTLPSTGQWQWVVMGDKAVGVNRSTSAANPVVVASPTATSATALGGSPPKALYAEVFNSRLYLVSATEPNRLHYSALGDPADHTTTGKAGAGSILVGGNEGDYITGIKEHLGRLFIFKRSRIYVLVPGSPNTDNQQWVVQMLTDRVGGYGYTIQPVLSDLVFLSDLGVMSLSAVQQVGDFRHAVLSTKVLELREFNKTTLGACSVNNSDRLQYWVAVPELAGSSTNTVTWVMDYTGMAGGGSVAWTKFSGRVVGTAYAQIYENGRPLVYVGNSYGLYRYGDEGVFDDAGTVYEKVLLTKALSPGPALWRKEFHRYGWEFETETNNGELLLSYRLNESDELLKTVTVPFGLTHTGGRWDEAVWGTDAFATTGSSSQEFISRFAGTVGRRGQTVQFRLYNNRSDGFAVKRLTIDANMLTRTHAGDLEV